MKHTKAYLDKHGERVKELEKRIAPLVEGRAKGKTLAALGKEFGVSQERVRQLLHGHERREREAQRAESGQPGKVMVTINARVTKAMLAEYEGKTLEECLQKLAADLYRSRTEIMPSGLTVLAIDVQYHSRPEIDEGGPEAVLMVALQ